MLATALERKAEKEEAERLHEEIRLSIITLYSLNAEIEPGPLQCRVITSEEKRFSFEKLAEVLGKEEAKAVRRSLPVTVVKKLRIS